MAMAGEYGTVEFRLGQLDAGQKALIAEVHGLRNDILARFAQHDLRDDERFNSHSARLTAIEKHLAIDEDRDARQGEHGDRRQRERHAWLGFTGVIIAAIVGSLVTLWATGFHP